MQLYEYFRSSAAYRVRIALNWKQLHYESIPIHLVQDGGQQHQSMYQQLNPQKLVPTLKDHDTVLTQSLAILEYLEEQYPEPSLLPKEASTRAAIRAFAMSIACDLHPLNNLRVLQYLKGPLQQEEAETNRWYRHWIELGFEALEMQLQRRTHGGPFCFGEQFSFADICLIPQVYNAKRFHCPMEPYPLLNQINEACLQLPAVQKAIPENQPDAP